MDLGRNVRLTVDGSVQRTRYQLATQMWNLYEASTVGDILTIAEPQIDFRTPVEQLTKNLL